MSIIYTVGHSNHTIDHFLDLLKANSITAIADVRSHPYSKFTPHFSKDALKIELDKNNISYVFLGKELGVRSDNSECYVNGKVQYDLLAKQECFTQGIDRLKQGMNIFLVYPSESEINKRIKTSNGNGSDRKEQQHQANGQGGYNIGFVIISLVEKGFYFLSKTKHSDERKQETHDYIKPEFIVEIQGKFYPIKCKQTADVIERIG